MHIAEHASPGRISIHALLAESDQYWATRARAAQLFLSTLSLRRATAIGRRGRAARGNFYPRSPCGERQHLLRAQIAPFFNFYPRSPCGERRERSARLLVQLLFLSTLSLRRATPPSERGCPLAVHFYPRSPCGERQKQAVQLCESWIFLSTLSLRRATRIYALSRSYTVISIHALLAESDGFTKIFMKFMVQFLSTLSLRRATRPDACMI